MTDGSTDASLLRIALVVLAILLFVPLLTMAFAMPMMGMMGWWGGSGMGYSPLWGIGLVFLFLLVLLGGGYYLVTGAVGEYGADDPALAELRMAYARGDLSDEEFERRRQRLERNLESE